MRGYLSLLITSDALPRRGPPRVERLGAVVCAAATGDATDQSPKAAPFEDALAILERGDGARFGAVADAHFGPLSSGLLVRLFAERAREVEADEAGLRRAAERAIEELAQRLPKDERSVTTFGAFAAPGPRGGAKGGAIAWLSVGDSYLLRQEASGALRLLNQPRPYYVGARAQSYDQPAHPLAEAMESGLVELAAGERLLLATDGVEPDQSGLDWPEAGELLSSGSSLEEGVRAFVAKACHEDEGGGGDNLALVALAAHS